MQRRHLLSLALIAIGAAVYANSLNGAFVFDDTNNIIEEPDIRSLSAVLRSLGQTHRPIVKLTLAFNYALGELDVRGYHAVNLAIHVLASLTLFGIVRRALLIVPVQPPSVHRADWLAWIVALIWLAHPLQTQAVTYVIQRGESLMGLFYLLTVYAALRCATGSKPYAWGMVAVAACSLGMATKEVMVTAPIMVLLLDGTMISRSFAAALRRHWGLHLALALTWLVLFVVIDLGNLLQPRPSAGFALDRVTPLQYALSQPQVVMHYLRLSLWPDPLCLDYYWPPAVGVLQILPPAIAVLIMLSATGWALWRRSWLGFAGAWFFLMLAPTSSVMPIADLAVEHRMYLPLAAVILLLVIGIERLLNHVGAAKPVAAAVLVIAVAATLAALTLRRNFDYRTPLTIWQQALRAAQNNPRAYYNLGYYHQSRLDNKEAAKNFRAALQIEPQHFEAHNNLALVLKAQGQIDEAIGHFRQAVGIKADYAIAHYNLAMALQSQGELEEAIAHYRQADRLEPQRVAVKYNLAVALEAAGRYDDAIEYYLQALRIEPDHYQAHNNVANVYRRMRILDHAVKHYRRALDINPNFAIAHYNLATALTTLGKAAQAIGHLQRALQLDPDNAMAHYRLGRLLAATDQPARAYEHLRAAVRLAPQEAGPANILARMLITHPHLNEHRIDEAIELAQRAADLTNRRNPHVLNTLAAAHATAGHRDLAISIAQAALDLAAQAGAHALADELSNRLARYERIPLPGDEPNSDQPPPPGDGANSNSP